jgi:predicted TIM-barrel fold metal-dependent hydrolase
MEKAGRNEPVILDAHVHVFPDEVRDYRGRFCGLDHSFAAIYQDPKARLASVEDLLRALEEVGANGAVVCGFAWEDLEIAKIHNDYIREACCSSGGRLIGLGCVSPLVGKKGIQELERCLKMGLGGVGEIAHYSDRSKGFCSVFYRDVSELLISWRRPLLVHTTESVGHGYHGKDRTNLQALLEWIQAYPDLDVVLAHWGGGLFFFELMPEVGEACRHIYYDTAASPLLYRREVYRVAVEILGFDRILMGSDFPLIHPKRCIQEIQSQGLPGQAMDGILGQNAARLWQWNQGT